MQSKFDSETFRGYIVKTLMRIQNIQYSLLEHTLIMTLVFITLLRLPKYEYCLVLLAALSCLFESFCCNLFAVILLIKSSTSYIRKQVLSEVVFLLHSVSCRGISLLQSFGCILSIVILLHCSLSVATCLLLQFHTCSGSFSCNLFVAVSLLHSVFCCLFVSICLLQSHCCDGPQLSVTVSYRQPYINA